jgi:hypothetical protein
MTVGKGDRRRLRGRGHPGSVVSATSRTSATGAWAASARKPRVRPVAISDRSTTRAHGSGVGLPLYEVGHAWDCERHYAVLGREDQALRDEAGARGAKARVAR